MEISTDLLRLYSNCHRELFPGIPLPLVSENSFLCACVRFGGSVSSGHAFDEFDTLFDIYMQCIY